jgi:CRP/FNR family transcriptional regulator
MKKHVVGDEVCAQSCADCAVRPHAVCAALDDDELRQLDQLGHRQHYRANEAVFGQEEIVLSCYNLLEGVLRLYKLLPDGRRQIVGFALPGDFIGLSTNGRHGLSADTVGAAAVCRFVKSSFWRFAEDKPKLLQRINELVTRDLAEAQEQMVLLGRRSAEEKVAIFLIKWRERLAQVAALAEVTPLPMSRQDIADYLGLTIETVSRTFTKLERDGVIEIVSGGIRLTDVKRAAALAAA